MVLIRDINGLKKSEVTDKIFLKEKGNGSAVTMQGGDSNPSMRINRVYQGLPEDMENSVAEMTERTWYEKMSFKELL